MTLCSQALQKTLQIEIFEKTFSNISLKFETIFFQNFKAICPGWAIFRGVNGVNFLFHKSYCKFPKICQRYTQSAELQ